MKQKQQIIVLVVLVVVAVLIWSFQWRKPASSTETASFIQGYPLLAVENPQIRWAELDRAQKTEYKSNGRNPFSIIAAPTPQEVQAKADAAKPKDPPPPPPPPPPPTTAFMPPNLKYFGYGTVGNGTPRLAFFYDGEETYVVTEGDTLLGRYRILKVGNTNLQFQEISTGLPGTTQLDEQAVPPSA
jgi:hypothetical protein